VNSRRLRVHDAESLRRRRLIVFLRALLFVPHYIVLSIWGLLIVPVLAVSWIVALFSGRVPRGFHRFLAAHLRYQGQAYAWLALLSATYPDPLHTREHPFGIETPDARRQPRLVTLFRLVLALPALVLASVFGVVLTGVAVAAWFVGLVVGRTTAGLQELGTFCLRYQLETHAYVALVTSAYPRLEPVPPPAEQLLLPGFE
jgi:Domain of unknown function (DUF4389)